jgi:hypothetical protein
MKGSNILSGIIGAAILLFVVFAITAWLKPFNYQAVYIVNPETVIADSLQTDILTCNQIAVLKDLEKKGVLLTPQEYTSHISSYYSTLVAFLIGLFVLFTIGSIYGVRITSRREMEEAKDEIRKELKKSLADELKDSKAFYENIVSDILGRIEDDIVTKEDKALVDDDLKSLTNKQIKMEDDINLLFEMTDSKSEIN